MQVGLPGRFMVNCNVVEEYSLDALMWERMLVHAYVCLAQMAKPSCPPAIPISKPCRPPVVKKGKPRWSKRKSHCDHLVVKKAKPF